MKIKILLVVLVISIIIMGSSAIAVKPETLSGLLEEKNLKAPGQWKKNTEFESQKHFVNEIHSEILIRLEQSGVLSSGLIRQLVEFEFENEEEFLPPVAIISCETTVYENTPVSFNADESYDPDGGVITLVEWDINGNGNYEIIGLNPYLEVYEPGTYTIGLRVTDDEEQTGVALVTITVLEKVI